MELLPHLNFRRRISLLMWSRRLLWLPAIGSLMWWRTSWVLPVTVVVAVLLAKALKAAGIRFVGPTTAYALMQATGMVFDHPPTCWRWAAYPHAS